MHPHHRRAIEAATERFRADPEVLALLLGGSIAHGFASEGSDVDLLIVVSDADHAARIREGRLQFLTADGCDWPGGYAEGKYVSPAFLAQVAASGSEPARFAFADAQILFARIDDLGDRVAAIARYPVAGKAERIASFHAQFETWHWYAHEGLRLGDRYLTGIGVAKMVLFGARMFLAHNERLFPFHKWLMRTLAAVPQRPPDLLERIAAVQAEPTQASLLALWSCVKNFRPWEGGTEPWPLRFLHDTELAWQRGPVPIEDL
jgi:Nucleotidyltransferase domain